MAVDQHFDFIVVGAGAAGCLTTLRLLQAGKRVLLLDQGYLPAHSSITQPEPIRINQAMTQPKVGQGFGGSSNLYGGVLLRPSPQDFSPGRYYRPYLTKELWDWPISYEELQPYYDWLEDLFTVSGCQKQRIPFLAKREKPYRRPAMDLIDINRSLIHELQKQGLKPFRLPMALQLSSCLHCTQCAGTSCPTQARPSAFTILQRYRSSWHQLSILQGSRVKKLIQAGSAIASILIEHRSSPQARAIPLRLRANCVILAAGATGSAAILQQSDLRGLSLHAGRNFMFHLGALAAILLKRPLPSYDARIKQIGLSDYYFGTKDFPHKLGYIQSIGLPDLSDRFGSFGKPIAKGLQGVLRRRVLVYAMSIEDLPNPSNRILFHPRTGLHLEHRFHPYDLFRGHNALKIMRKTFSSPLSFKSINYLANFEHRYLAHQVGTCRMSFSKATGVVDRYGRVYDFDNLYIVDGSTLPTSLGVGPALTIMANACRIADHISGQNI